ncbi:hypothetical protein ABT144_34190, partial [Streptomyces sp. NPDC002039]
MDERGAGVPWYVLDGVDQAVAAVTTAAATRAPAPAQAPAPATPAPTATPAAPGAVAPPARDSRKGGSGDP